MKGGREREQGGEEGGEEGGEVIDVHKILMYMSYMHSIFVRTL